MDKKIIIKTKWNKYNTTLLTKKLYGHVEKGQIELTLNAKKGSLETEFIIVIIHIEMWIAKTLINYLINRMRRIRKKGREQPPPIIIIDNRTQIIYGDERNR